MRIGRSIIKRDMGAYKIVEDFEKEIAEYAGSKYAIAIESCTAAIFLCCKFSQVRYVHIPKYTYPGVACSIIHAGGMVFFTDEYWQGIYKLRPYEIYDSALRFQRNMYAKGSLFCLSFHYKKHLPIGRGGMILTDDREAVTWFKRARFDGRDECSLKDQKTQLLLGWNMYMTPEQAARGLMLFELIKDKELADIPREKQGYIDLSKQLNYKR